MSDLIERLRNMHFNNAEEGRGGPFREISARDLRNANELFTKSANTLESRDKTIAELVAALGAVRDRFFPEAQPERDRDILWELVNDAISQAKSKDKAE